MMRRMSMSSAATTTSGHLNTNASTYRRRPSVAGVLASNSTGTGTGTGMATITSAITAAKSETTSVGEDPASAGLGPPGPCGGLADVDGRDLRRVPTYMQPSLPWRKRLLHFTFAWYTVT